MINLKNKKAAMEMSMGTIVTIVLLMSVLVLGIFMIQNIFDVSDQAISGVSTEMNSQIDQLFGKDGAPLVIVPSSQRVTLKRGGDPAGFGFKIQNDINEIQDFTYTITATGESKLKEKCGSGMTIEKANTFLQVDEGSFSLGPGKIKESVELILMDVPKAAPVCTITYQIDVKGDQSFVETGKVFVTLK